MNMELGPNVSVPHLADGLLTKENIKASQHPQDEVMSGTTSPELSSPSGRASFSSVREVDNDIAQAFSSTKVSSYNRHGSDTAVSDDSLSGPPSASLEMTETMFCPPVTMPNSKLHGCWFPAVAADNFQGWKQIGVKGKQASRSYGDLRALRMVWTPTSSINTTPKKPEVLVEVVRTPGDSSLEKLPTELKSECFHLPLFFPFEGSLAHKQQDSRPTSSILVFLLGPRYRRLAYQEVD
ncbi:hypothetical protein F4808DRAFT_68266 [Astrocystis sublimbata]|nr:hypothetical protein F4808DRAFT_68266 [Astrocystis sublimbata]